MSFLDVLTDMPQLRLFPFVVSRFSNTEPGECEFFVCLSAAMRKPTPSD